MLYRALVCFWADTGSLWREHSNRVLRENLRRFKKSRSCVLDQSQGPESAPRQTRQERVEVVRFQNDEGLNKHPELLLRRDNKIVLMML